MSECECQHQINISMCQLKNCTNCEYKGHIEDCPFHIRKAKDDSTPTFEQMLDIYHRGGSAIEVTYRVVSRSVINDLAVVGLTLQSKADEMTKQRFKDLIASFMNPDRKPCPLANLTIAQHLNCFRAISSDHLDDLYEENGLFRPLFRIPVFKRVKPPVQEVTDDQARLVEIQMEKWLASGRAADRSCYIYCFFGIYCGMRSGDVCWAKWDILQMTEVGIMLKYKPRKTAKKGNLVANLINHKVYCKIKPLIGRPDEWVIPRFDNRIGKDVERDGLYKGRHRYMTTRVNKAIRACGIGGTNFKKKAFHALRKYFETDLAMMTSRKFAADAVGHGLDAQRDSYLGTLAGKIGC